MRGWLLGVSRGTKVLLAENGDLIRFDAEGGRIADKVPAGRILIDGTRSGEVGDEVLRDRRHLAGDGLVVPVVAISRQTGHARGNARTSSPAGSSSTRGPKRC